MTSEPKASTAQPAPPTFSRELLERGKLLWLHQGRSLVQADVCGYEIEGKRIVVKDFKRRPWLIRRWWGRWVLRREWERLERLQGIAGIPRLIGWIDEDAFAMEWLEAKRLPAAKRDSALEPIFFERLAQLVARMHERGIGHGDLRRKNVLVGVGQQPYLVDFATAFRLGTSRHSRRLFERYRRIDDLKVTKLKHYYCPGSLTDEERARLVSRPLLLRVGQFMRSKIYRPFLKPRRWRRRWKRLRRFFSGAQPENDDPHER
jgi:predicted Ser/Thr protein kinase